MSDPLVSVIVPVFNEENIISRFLEVFLKQNYKNFEIIVVDGQSSDKTVSIVRDYIKIDKRVKIAFENPRTGLGNARNIGLSIAKGEIIKFEDADWIETDPDFLDDFVKVFKGNPDVMVVARKRRMNLKGISRFEKLFALFNLTMRTYPKWGFPGYYMAYRKVFLEKVGYFKPKLFWGEEKDFLKRVLDLNPKIIIGNPFYSTSDIHFFADFPKRYRSYGRNFFDYESTNVSKLTFIYPLASLFCIFIPILLFSAFIFPQLFLYGISAFVLLLVAVYFISIKRMRTEKISKKDGLLALFLPFLVLIQGWSFIYGLLEGLIKKFKNYYTKR